MAIMLKSRGEREEKPDTDENKGIALTNREQKRMYSFKQLFNIFTVVNNNSVMHDRMSTGEEQIINLQKEVTMLKQDDKNLRKYVDEQLDALRKKRLEDNEAQNEINEDYEKRIEESKAGLGKHLEVISTINRDLKNLKSFAENNLQKDLNRAFLKLDNFKTDTYANIAATKEDLKERIGDLDKIYAETMEEMSGTIESVRVMARDSV